MMTEANQPVIVSIQHKALAECQANIDHLLSLSRAICEAAREGDWELALARQKFRSTELARFYATPQDMPQEVAELIAFGIRQILAIDAEVTDLACHGRAALREEAGQQQRRGKAVKAYLQQGNP